MAKQQPGSKIMPMKGNKKKKKDGDGKQNLPYDTTKPKTKPKVMPFDTTKPKTKAVPLSAKVGSFKMVPAKGAENQNPARPAPSVKKAGVGRKSIISAPATKKPLANPSRVTKSPGKPVGMANKSSNVKSTFVRRPQGR